MAINFPNSPSVGDIFTASTGVIYNYDGVKWEPTAGGPSNDIQLNSLGVGTPASGVSGEIVATGDITSNASDDRLKTRLGGIENAIDKVSTLSGFYFEFNDTAIDLGLQKGQRVGVSAQEVQSVLPEVVKDSPVDSEYLTVQYEKLVPLLIEAIKEQQEQIDELKNKLYK